MTSTISPEFGVYYSLLLHHHRNHGKKKKTKPHLSLTTDAHHHLNYAEVMSGGVRLIKNHITTRLHATPDSLYFAYH